MAYVVNRLPKKDHWIQASSRVEGSIIWAVIRSIIFQESIPWFLRKSFVNLFVPAFALLKPKISPKMALCIPVLQFIFFLPQKILLLHRQVDATDPPMQFRQGLDLNEEGEGQGRVSVRTFVFELRSRGPKAQKKVDGFIDDAFEFYKMKKGEEIDKSRYLYQPVLSSGSKKEDASDDEGDKVGGCSLLWCLNKKIRGWNNFLAFFLQINKTMNLAITLSHTLVELDRLWSIFCPWKARQYKRYLLADNKSFDTLFFPEKCQLLKLVDDFMHGRGKFEIPGFPNKLGILLDGPPGTGKTSLIKALAIYLKRHIVSVSLEKVKTNQEWGPIFSAPKSHQNKS